MHIPQALSLDQNNVTLCLTVLFLLWSGLFPGFCHSGFRCHREDLQRFFPTQLELGTELDELLGVLGEGRGVEVVLDVQCVLGEDRAVQVVLRVVVGCEREKVRQGPTG